MATRSHTEVPFGVVICRSAVDIVRHLCTDPRDWSKLIQQIDFCYPDGSIQLEYVLTEGEGPLDWFILKYGLFGGALQAAPYRSLAPFGDREFTFNRPGDKYDRLVMSDGFGINPACFTEPLACEWDLSNIWVVITFHRKPSRTARQRLADTLERWEREAERGLRGEGPPKSCSGSIKFGGKLAKFSIDFSCAGQTTVNWLILSLFSFGLENGPLTSIRVAPPDEWLQHSAFTA